MMTFANLQIPPPDLARRIISTEFAPETVHPGMFKGERCWGSLRALVA